MNKERKQIKTSSKRRNEKKKFRTRYLKQEAFQT